MKIGDKFTLASRKGLTYIVDKVLQSKNAYRVRDNFNKVSSIGAGMIFREGTLIHQKTIGVLEAADKWRGEYPRYAELKKKEFKVGDQVIMNNIPRNHPDFKYYANTDAKIIGESNNGFDVELYDGKKIWSTSDHFTLPEDYYAKPENKLRGISTDGCIMPDDELVAPREDQRELLFGKLKEELGDLTCTHPKKYINKAMQTNFWVCPCCGKDLGDA